VRLLRQACLRCDKLEPDLSERKVSGPETG